MRPGNDRGGRMTSLPGDVDRRRMYLSLSAPGAVFLLHLVLYFVFDAYRRCSWIDAPVHFAGGVALTYFIVAVLVYLQRDGAISALDGRTRAVFAFCILCTSAVFWEFLEFAGDRMFGSNIQVSLANTMRDLFCGLLGSGAYLACGRPGFSAPGRSAPPAP